MSVRFIMVVVIAGALASSAPPAAAQGGSASTGGTLGLELGAATSPTASAGISAKKKCSGLRGTKLRRCRAIAKCKKFRGKKRKRCLAKARRIGAKRPQPPVRLPTPPPPKPPLPVPPPANRLPLWPNPLQSQASTQLQYDPTTGFLIGATTTINVLSPAVDPDGDPLTYTWTVTNGSVTASGLSATWTRVISLGQPSSGTAAVTASDGKGGTARFEFRFL